MPASPSPSSSGNCLRCPGPAAAPCQPVIVLNLLRPGTGLSSDVSAPPRIRGYLLSAQIINTVIIGQQRKSNPLFEKGIVDDSVLPGPIGLNNNNLTIYR